MNETSYACDVRDVSSFFHVVAKTRNGSGLRDANDEHDDPRIQSENGSFGASVFHDVPKTQNGIVIDSCVALHGHDVPRTWNVNG